jgi:quinol monooxygenase YgiN
VQPEEVTTPPGDRRDSMSEPIV